jgi:hypothetical protein
VPRGAAGDPVGRLDPDHASDGGDDSSADPARVEGVEEALLEEVIAAVPVAQARERRELSREGGSVDVAAEGCGVSRHHQRHCLNFNYD